MTVADVAWYDGWYAWRVDEDGDRDPSRFTLSVGAAVRRCNFKLGGLKKAAVSSTG
jgi:hypothetical protein